MVEVCPVDPYVGNDYFGALKELEIQGEKGEANLVLMGIEPTYPSEKYGYIIPQNADKVSQVSTLKNDDVVVIDSERDENIDLTDKEHKITMKACKTEHNIRESYGISFILKIRL